MAILSIIAIKNHPDITSVLDYLAEHNIIPPVGDCPYNGFLPYDNEDSQSVLNWLTSDFKVAFDDFGGKEIRTWHYWDSKNDYLIVLADCETPEEESAVADRYRTLMEREGSLGAPEAIVLTNDTDPDACLRKFRLLLPTADEIDGWAFNLLREQLGDIQVNEASTDFYDHDETLHETEFTYLGKNFTFRVIRDSDPEAVRYVVASVTGETRVDPLHLKRDIHDYFFDYKHEIVNFHFGSDYGFTDTTDYSKPVEQVTFEATRDGHSVRLSIDATHDTWYAVVDDSQFTDVLPVDSRKVQEQVEKIFENFKRNTGDSVHDESAENNSNSHSYPKDYRNEIVAIVKGPVKLSPGEPDVSPADPGDERGDEIVYHGTFGGTQANFIVYSNVPWEVSVQLYSDDGSLRGDIVKVTLENRKKALLMLNDSIDPARKSLSVEERLDRIEKHLGII